LINSLRVVFAGTPEFARCALEQLFASAHQVVGILTQPDRPAGRGLKLQASAVKGCALLHHTPLHQPQSLRLDGRYPSQAMAAKNFLEELRPDVLVVAAYGLLLPTWALNVAPKGALNIHASLLPRWRGAAPIQRAIEAGDKETGICIMQMDEGLDTGCVLLRQSCAISTCDTADSLHDRLSSLGAELIVKCLNNLSDLKPVAQSEVGATYARKIEKSESWIDWELSAVQIGQKMRAFTKTPGLQTQLSGGGDLLKIWSGHQLTGSDCLDLEQSLTPITATSSPKAGTICKLSSLGIDVQTGEGFFRITELQRSGGKRMSAQTFLQGSSVKKNDVFVSSPNQSNN